MCVCCAYLCVLCVCALSVCVCVWGYTCYTHVWYNHVSADNCTHLLGTNALCSGCRLSLLLPDIFDIGHNVYIIVLKHVCLIV